MNEVRKDDEQDMVDATNRELAKYKAHGLEETSNLQAHKGENGNITYGGGVKKGGAINLKNCKVNTCKSNPKCKSF
jgi:hypothetical protein